MGAGLHFDSISPFLSVLAVDSKQATVNCNLPFIRDSAAYYNIIEYDYCLNTVNYN